MSGHQFIESNFKVTSELYKINADGFQQNGT